MGRPDRHNAVQIMQDHDYFECSTSDYVLGYITGFVARKATKFAKYNVEKKPFICDSCILSLHLSDDEIHNKMYELIQIRTKGFLIEPSLKLVALISALEHATLKTINTSTINTDTIFLITKAVEEIARLPLVGCETHKISFTHRVITFF